jgi:uncharacterized phiE125 gp8 family phage protein
MGWELKTAPAAAVISTIDAKDHVKVTNDDEDDYIDSLVSSVTDTAETFLGRKLITQTWTLYLDRFPWNGSCIEPPFGKLQAVNSIKYYDSDGVLRTLDPTQYQVDIRGLGRIEMGVSTFSWPLTQLYKINAVEIEFVVGYGTDPSSIPPAIIEALKLMLSDLYNNREDDFKISRGTYTTASTAEYKMWPHRLVNI